jgi:YidC/Oxa1 family membrane protein insertase
VDKRTIWAIVLCGAILLVWSKFFAPPPAPPPAPAAQHAPAEVNKVGAPAEDAAAAPAGTAAAGQPGASAASAYPERETKIETATEEFVFTNRGASLRHVRLTQPKYKARPGDPSSPGIDLIRTNDAKLDPLRISFPDSGFQAPADTAWRLVDDAPPPPAGIQQVIYRAETPAVRIEKRFTFDSNRYRMQLDVTVANRGTAPVDHHLAVQLSGHQDPEAKGGFLSGSTGNTAAVLCHVDDDTTRVPIEKLEKEPLQKVGGVNWIGTDEKFFLLAVVPYPETPPKERKCAASFVGNGSAVTQLSFAERNLPPGGSTSYAFAVYVGPKVISDLDEVRPGGVDVKLTKSVDVTLSVISVPMLWLLKFFQRYVHNWGIAIILLTIFIRLLTWYPTQKSLLSAKKMQRLGPKLAVIRKKYENDKQRQSVETMNLYKSQGVSPFGGCLPSLIQMPIWIALYSTLNYAVELYRSPFIFHLKDLTAKDPYYITPLLMGGVMFVQMKMSPTSPDNQQQAMMSFMMPIMFTAFSLVLPSGLAVYMLTSYLIGIFQQLWINHLDRKHNGPQISNPAPSKA